MHGHAYLLYLSDVARARKGQQGASRSLKGPRAVSGGQGLLVHAQLTRDEQAKGQQAAGLTKNPDDRVPSPSTPVEDNG
jgi:hypothetical protein